LPASQQPALSSQRFIYAVNLRPSTSNGPKKVSDPKCATFYRWDDMPKERVSDTLERRLITGDKMMLAHVYLAKGCVVPKHQHENEQLTYILEGALHFFLGENQTEEVIVRAGEVLHIPSNLPHKAIALEDTLDVDIFDPPRQDWLDRTDNYLRK
jgi:quercetin dioxygenase-like cupin family protein